jgi:hypothetical protein
LTGEECLALRQQGFISQHLDGKGRTSFKLRFRYAGRQRVRCLGSNPAFVEGIQGELERLQHEYQLQRQLVREVKHARRLLRESKSALKDMLEAAGFRFHGYGIRRSRGTTK